MKIIKRESCILEMSKDHEPVEKIKSGESIVFECLDCYGNQIIKEDQDMSEVDWTFNNPSTGPLYIEGVEEGDIVKVEILDIRVEDQGVMTSRPGAGALKDKWDKLECSVIPIENNKAVFNDKISIPLNPMVGVIGLAPKNESIKNSTPDYHGGNMDCKRITKGATLYLKSNVEGGLLSMGDIHGVMGDGEVSISGLEMNGEVEVKVTVLKEYRIPTPSVTTEDLFMTIYSAETLDEAAVKATDDMFEFLINNIDISRKEAGNLLSLIGNLRINQIVDPLMTVRMELPREVFDKYNYKFL
ncbi:MAG: acetamidase/formamidase family protein [Eubacteriales bacterium]